MLISELEGNKKNIFSVKVVGCGAITIPKTWMETQHIAGFVQGIRDQRFSSDFINGRISFLSKFRDLSIATHSTSRDEIFTGGTRTVSSYSTCLSLSTYYWYEIWELDSCLLFQRFASLLFQAFLFSTCMI